MQAVRYQFRNRRAKVMHYHTDEHQQTLENRMCPDLSGVAVRCRQRTVERVREKLGLPLSKMFVIVGAGEN